MRVHPHAVLSDAATVTRLIVIDAATLSLHNGYLNLRD